MGRAREGCFLVLPWLLFALMQAPALAQARMPQSTIRFVIAIPAGGVGDAVIRIASQYLQAKWKVPVVVDNRPGGNGAIAAVAVARAAGDGTTMLVIQDAAFTSSPALSSVPLNYSLDDFAPIMPLVAVTPVIAVNASLPISSIEDLRRFAKENPNRLSYGSFGVGTYSHLSMEDLRLRAGINLLHVPYKGSAAAVQDLVSGQISLILGSISTVDEFAKSGALRLIASATPQRIVAHASLPTVSETGFPGFETSAWFGLFGPRAMPDDLVDVIRKDMTEALNTSAAKDYFHANSVTRADMSSQEFRNLIERDTRHWTGLIRTLNIRSN